MKQEFHPKAFYLLDKPNDLDENGFVPDYAVTDDMILLKGSSSQTFNKLITSSKQCKNESSSSVPAAILFLVEVE